MIFVDYASDAIFGKSVNDLSPEEKARINRFMRSLYDESIGNLSEVDQAEVMELAAVER
jgi:hypothetical protein